MNMDENSLVKEICEKTGKGEEEILSLIEAKELEFSGMVSRIGAAYIVGRELGVNLIKPVANVLKIKNIVPDLSRVTFFGKVVQISPVREFETERGKGKVANLILSDETGTIRIPLWNEKTDMLGGNDAISVGDVVEIAGAYTKKDSLGRAELQLGKYGTIKKNNNFKIDAVSSVAKQPEGYKDATLDNISDNDFVNIKATILQVFERKPIYRTCSVCKDKLEGVICEKHPDAKPDRLLIVSALLDDGYSPINAVFFREAAENILQKTVDEIEKLMLTKGERAVWSNMGIVGGNYEVKGLVRKNDMMNRLELVVHNAAKINPVAECKRLFSEFNEPVKII